MPRDWQLNSVSRRRVIQTAVVGSRALVPDATTADDENGTGTAAGTGSHESTHCPAFVIEVVDSETGDGVPQLALETVDNERYHTDGDGRLIPEQLPNCLWPRRCRHLRGSVGSVRSYSRAVG